MARLTLDMTFIFGQPFLADAFGLADHLFRPYQVDGRDLMTIYKHLVLNFGQTLFQEKFKMSYTFLGWGIPSPTGDSHKNYRFERFFFRLFCEWLKPGNS